MLQPKPIVHFIAGAESEAGGISRYCQELYPRLQEHADVRLCRLRVPRLAKRFSTLQHLPLGVTPDAKAGIYHFTRIMGCALMLWRPVHPAVATVHDLGPLLWRPEWESTGAIDKLVFRLSLMGLKRMDRLIADSVATANSIVTYLNYPRDHITVIPLGVDHERFRPIPDARQQLQQAYQLAFPDGLVTLLYVGSEAPRKNLGVLLQAMAQLREQGMRVRLIKAGGAGRPDYRRRFTAQIAELGLAEAVVLQGFVPDGDLPLFYNAADIYVIPSWVEGFGLPAVEVMACGTPVVYANTTSLPEVIGDAGLAFDPAQAKELAEAIARLAAQPELARELAAKGLEKAAAYRWEEAVALMLQLYHKMRTPA